MVFLSKHLEEERLWALFDNKGMLALLHDGPTSVVEELLCVSRQVSPTVWVLPQLHGLAVQLAYG